MTRTRKRERLTSEARLARAARNAPRLFIVADDLATYGEFCDRYEFNPYSTFHYTASVKAAADVAENRRLGGPPTHIVILDESGREAGSALAERTGSR